MIIYIEMTWLDNECSIALGLKPVKCGIYFVLSLLMPQNLSCIHTGSMSVQRTQFQLIILVKILKSFSSQLLKRLFVRR